MLLRLLLLAPLFLAAACTARQPVTPRPVNPVLSEQEPLPAGITPLTVEQDEMLRR